MAEANPYQVQILKGPSGAWYWRIRRSGRTVSSSETYSSRGKAWRSARNIAKGLGVEASVIED
jgi:uncharacterized protein YegP (UPF0339 family)